MVFGAIDSSNADGVGEMAFNRRRMTFMRASAWLRGALRPRAPRRLFFIVNNRNHVRIFAPVIHRLTELAHPCIIADIERESGDRGARRELAAAGLSSVGIDVLQAQISRNDALVVANDWYPTVVVETMQLCAQRGVLRIGVVEGARFAHPDRYRHVDQVLGWGPSSRDTFKIPVDVVGSPIIEAAWRRPPSAAPFDFAVIAFKHPGAGEATQREWLEQTTSACRTAGLPFEITCHPSYRLPPPFVPSQREFRDLMPGAAVLITQPSTLVHEAMAAGKPVVLFPAANEPLMEFVDPKGAFEIARGPADLPALLRAALAGQGRLPGALPAVPQLPCQHRSASRRGRADCSGADKGHRRPGESCSRSLLTISATSSPKETRCFQPSSR